MAAFAEYGAQRIDLGLVADAGAGAVRLDQVDRHRVDAAALVGAAHGQQFALEAWREQTLGATVGRGADTTHDGVNAVTIALGVGAAFQHQHADAFAKQRAFRAFLEWPDAIARQRVDPAELHEDLRRRVRLGAADRSEEHTSELQSLMRISYAVFCLK